MIDVMQHFMRKLSHLQTSELGILLFTHITHDYTTSTEFTEQELELIDSVWQFCAAASYAKDLAKAYYTYSKGKWLDMQNIVNYVNIQK